MIKRFLTSSVYSQAKSSDAHFPGETYDNKPRVITVQQLSTCVSFTEASTSCNPSLHTLPSTPAKTSKGEMCFYHSLIPS